MIDEAPSAPFALRLRLPAWAGYQTTATLNDGADITVGQPGEYGEISRVWQAGDRLRLRLPLSVRRLAGHPYIADTRGSVALARGPLVYCLEQVDHAGVDVRDIVLPTSANFRHVHRPDLLGGVSVLEAEAQAASRSGWEHRLYQSAEAGETVETRPVTLTAVPYYAWANRASGSMRVWIPATGGVAE
jgi:DUF1680 family protein